MFEVWILGISLGLSSILGIMTAAHGDGPGTVVWGIVMTMLAWECRRAWKSREDS